MGNKLLLRWIISLVKLCEFYEVENIELKKEVKILRTKIDGYSDFEDEKDTRVKDLEDNIMKFLTSRKEK
ncbi:hypothetical protein [Paraliobacillus ryukyuensis]|uniref:hypothetical protein n=1 Tax=Paraliobacillus ryukyuensis TaxID=200904 RepID=UPI0009A7492A|nr:hypothetical protein [Paraliobacillus ryukyuensis]